MGRSHKAYALIAIHAGRAVGMNHLPTVAAAARMSDSRRAGLAARVADNPKAVKLRDEVYGEMERRIRDPGYNPEQVGEWFRANVGPISRSSMYRLADHLRLQDMHVRESAELAKAYMEMAGESTDDVLAAGNRLAAQYLFQLFLELNTSAGEKPDVGKVAKVVSALGSLQKTRAETEILQIKLAELRQKFDDQVRRAKAASSDGKLTDEMIDQVRKAVFGSV